MKAELRTLQTSDGDRLETAKQTDGRFCVSVRALVGPADGPGEESFDFDVCSPEWLAAELERYSIISGRFLLIARRFDPTEVEQYVRKRLAQASGADWPSVAAKLARWSQWEFEDYDER